MSASLLLSRLQHVRSTGPASWRADCPNGHQHARGSLAITQADDGRLLLCCFACNDVHGILAAVGLELADLFPERIKDPSPQARQHAREAFRRSAWAAALRVVAYEATAVEVAAGMLEHGEVLTDDDHERLLTAIGRIRDAREVLA